MIQCPRERRLVRESDCGRCEYHRRPDDVSIIWCRYRISRAHKNQKADAEIRMLNIQAEEAELNMLRWRSRGVEKAAQKYERDLADLRRQIKERKEKRDEQ